MANTNKPSEKWESKPQQWETDKTQTQKGGQQPGTSKDQNRGTQPGTNKWSNQ